MPTTTPLDPSNTLTPSPPATIRVSDLVVMLSYEDPDAYVQVVTRVANPDVGSDEVELRNCEGLERRFNGRKVVVVR